ncbi:MAG: hypothetical protein WCJ55_02900 [Chloroflexales bacterium]
MDQEIDLRPYLMALLRRWRLILACALALALVGSASLALIPQGRRAIANVLIIPSTSQITLDPRFLTTNDSTASNPTAARLALVNLASSYLLAGTVLQDVGQAAGSTAADPIQELRSQVKVDATNDMFQITVSDADPDRAQKIAEAWGKAYARLVADTYSRSQGQADLLTSDIAAAQQRYDDAQRAVESLLKDGQSVKVNNQIARLNTLLNDSSASQQQLYAAYLARTRQIDMILKDAQTMRDQADGQSTSSFVDSYTALLLRARVIDGATPLFQLSAADLAPSAVSTNSQLASLDQVIVTLTRRRDQLLAESNTLASMIASNNVDTVGLDSTTRQRYIDEVTALNSTAEQLQAKQTILVQQRDLARDTLLLLQRKREEQDVARNTPQIVVRFISANIEPQTSGQSRTVLGGVAGGGVGLVLGMLLALWLEVIIPALRGITKTSAGQPAARNDPPRDRPVSGD